MECVRTSEGDAPAMMRNRHKAADVGAERKRSRERAPATRKVMAEMAKTDSKHHKKRRERRRSERGERTHRSVSICGHLKLHPGQRNSGTHPSVGHLIRHRSPTAACEHVEQIARELEQGPRLVRGLLGRKGD